MLALAGGALIFLLLNKLPAQGRIPCSLTLMETMMSQQSSLRGNGYAISRDLSPKYATLESLKPLGRETRTHSPAPQCESEYRITLPLTTLRKLPETA